MLRWHALQVLACCTSLERMAMAISRATQLTPPFIATCICFLGRRVEAFLKAVDSMETKRRRATRALLIAGAPLTPRLMAGHRPAAAGRPRGWKQQCGLQPGPCMHWDQELCGHSWPSSRLPRLHPPPMSYTIQRLQSSFLAVFMGIGVAWYQYVYLLPKVQYNKVHPYTSWIPITGEAGLLARLSGSCMEAATDRWLCEILLRLRASAAV